jgi:hypothetical protein
MPPSPPARTRTVDGESGGVDNGDLVLRQPWRLSGLRIPIKEIRRLRVKTGSRAGEGLAVGVLVDAALAVALVIIVANSQMQLNFAGPNVP